MWVVVPIEQGVDKISWLLGRDLVAFGQGRCQENMNENGKLCCEEEAINFKHSFGNDRRGDGWIDKTTNRDWESFIKIERL